jgi:hypothetical protein
MSGPSPDQVNVATCGEGNSGSKTNLNRLLVNQWLEKKSKDTGGAPTAAYAGDFIFCAGHFLLSEALCIVGRAMAPPMGERK